MQTLRPPVELLQRRRTFTETGPGRDSHRAASAATAIVRAVSGSNHFRQRTGEEQRATWLELFFDLVFVFAVTQLSHLLLASSDACTVPRRRCFCCWSCGGRGSTPTWMTNWFDPGVGARAAGAAGGDGLEPADGGRHPQGVRDLALLFACSYVTLQVVAKRVQRVRDATGPRPSHRLQPDPRLEPGLPERCGWPAGSRRRGARTWLWIAALAVDYVGPSVGYWTPRLGRSATSGVGDRDRALCRAVPAVHHHRAGRVDRRHRGDRILARCSTSPIGTSLMVAFATIRRAVVALLRRGRLARAAVPVPVGRHAAGSRATPTPTCTFRSSPASSSSPWATRS